jgi:hypothetical protein
MFKFLVTRMEEPELTSPPGGGSSTDRCWANESSDWPGADAKCLSVWRWMLGAPLPRAAPETRESAVAALGLVAQLAAPGPDEAARLDAAYTLASMGLPAVEPLLQALRHEVAANLAINLARPHTNPAQGHARTALAALGGPAIAPLAAILRDGGGGWALRAAAADCLGDIGRPAGERSADGAVAALVSALDPPGSESSEAQESDGLVEGAQWVVRNAAEALGYIGAAATAALPALAALAVAAPKGKEIGSGWVVPSWIRHNAVLAIGRIVSLPALRCPFLPIS